MMPPVPLGYVLGVTFWSSATAVLESPVEVLVHPAQSFCWSQPVNEVPRLSGSEQVARPSCVPTAIGLLLQTLEL
jgi:hypothetical protein